MYRQNPDLKEYVLVDANSISIELFRRTNENNWQMIDYKLEDKIELKSINLTFPIEQLYEEITFTK
jgi:Uma2 family endonuclease